MSNNHLYKSVEFEVQFMQSKSNERKEAEDKETFYIDEVEFKANKRTKDGSIYLNCARKRQNGCKATARIVNGVVHKGTGNNADHCADCQASIPKAIQDLSEFMKERAKELATTTWTTANECWKLIDQECRQQTTNFRGVRKDQIISLINATRRKGFSTDMVQALSNPPLSMINEHLFLQSLFVFRQPDNDTLETIILHAHPELLFYSKSTVDLFIDGTFSITPKGFYQVMIVMIYEPSSKLYIPIFYALLQRKNKWTYWHFLHLIKVAALMQMNVKSITCDFELALHKEIGHQFPDATLVGCLFHWKQAIRRKFVKLGITKEKIKIAMLPGHLDMLCFVKEEDMDLGIDYVRCHMDEGQEQSKWNLFWKYFNTVWIQTYGVRAWNVSQSIDENLALKNRTNNALERFNRTVKTALGIHPALPKYVEGIRDLSCEYIGRIDNIRRNKEKVPVYQEVNVTGVPEDFKNWQERKEGYPWVLPQDLVEDKDESDEDEVGEGEGGEDESYVDTD